MQSYDPNVAVPMVVNGILHVLQACKKESGVKRVVLTSSSTAAASPQPNKVFTMDEKTWNTTAVDAAWAPPPYEGKIILPMRSRVAYVVAHRIQELILMAL
jgi:nucleoside-diphosphate-sugar epimerase